MTTAKVVFVTALPHMMDEHAHATTPEGFTTITVSNEATDDEKIAALADADFIFGCMPALSEPVLRTVPALKLIQLGHAGYDMINLELLQELGIPLATAGETNSPNVAENTVLLILAVYRKLKQATARVAEGGWLLDSPATDPFTYRDLVDKKVGLIGFGNIARHVAQRLQGFQCEIQAYNISAIDEDVKRKLGVQQVEFDELIKTSDIVSLHTPLTPKTKGMIGKKELAQMKPSAILINTSRGTVVDEAALIEALQEGRISAAGLDVTEVEPPALDNPLRTMENVVLTPHSGGSMEMRDRLFANCWQNIRDVWEGKAPKNLVTPG